VSEIILETFFLHQFYKNRRSYFRKPIDKPLEVEALSGAAILMNKNVIAKIGMLDEDLFWTEDMEFCYRAHKHELKIIYYPHTSILHHVGASGKKNLSVMLSKQVLTKITYFRKNHTKLAFHVVRAFRLLHIVSRIFILNIASIFNANRFAGKARAYNYTFVQFLKDQY
jgi:GT2 family glycosyltransferase